VECRISVSKKFSESISRIPEHLDAGSRNNCEVSQRNTDGIKNAIRNKYAEVSLSARGKFQYPTGMDGARALGYAPAILASAHPMLLESFCGVGNPFSLGSIRSGQAVLDYGCGAGFDLFVASKLVGRNGRVCGIDLTAPMVEKAKENLARAGVSTIEVVAVDSEMIPYKDGAFDIVISNGVINLCPDKPACLKEIYRVLKWGGRLQIADVVLEHELPAALADSPEAWSQ